jgi:hypothetical protein
VFSAVRRVLFCWNISEEKTRGTVDVELHSFLTWKLHRDERSTSRRSLFYSRYKVNTRLDRSQNRSPSCEAKQFLSQSGIEPPRASVSLMATSVELHRSEFIIWSEFSVNIFIRRISIISGTGVAICTIVEVARCNSRWQHWHSFGISARNFTQLGGSTNFWRHFVKSRVFGLMPFHDGWDKGADNVHKIVCKSLKKWEGDTGND